MSYNISVGDLVVYGDRQLRAIVKEIKMNPYFAGFGYNDQIVSIEFEDPNLFPRIMDVSLDSVTLFQQYQINKMKDCCCGLKYTREGGLHSDWCNVKNDE